MFIRQYGNQGVHVAAVSESAALPRIAALMLDFGTVVRQPNHACQAGATWRAPCGELAMIDDNGIE